MPKRKISEVWRWFKKNNDKKLAKCLTCGKEYKTSGNTSNLFDHIKRTHPELLREEEDEDVIESSPSSSSTISIANYFKRQNFYDNNSARKKELDRGLVNMIAVDFQPFEIVHDEGFRNFVKLLDPKYNLPSKGTLRNNYLVSVYDEVKDMLSIKLREAEFVSLTCDLWSSRVNQSYMTVTCHFFDKNFKFRSAVLSTSECIGSHTAENLSATIQSVLVAWELEKKVVSIVTDNAQNMIKCCELLRMKHLPCFAHTLNLVVQGALSDKEISAILKKCKDIVTYTKHSTVATANLKKEQRDMGKPELKLIQEVPTRWNSALCMIQRLLAVHAPLTVALSKTPKSPSALTADDILILEDVVQVLQPFESATTQLSGDSYITVSLIIPMIFEIYTKVAGACMKIEVGQKIQTSLIDGIISRLYPYEERTVCRLATLLDPRLKKEAFRGAENCKQAIGILQNELSSYVMPTNIDTNESDETDSEAPSPVIKFDFIEKRLREKKRTKTVDIIILLRQYFERANANTDPLLFWKVNGHDFAPLQKCALKYLSVPATSVPSERIFSKAGQIISNRRCNIKSKNVNMLIFLNQNKWLMS